MEINNAIINIITTTGSGLAIVAAAYYLVKPDIEKYLSLKSQGLRKDEGPQLLVLRLQAHERLILFIERINPANLLVRLHQKGLSLRNFQSILLHEIRTEYQHNVTQQLYISPKVWKVIDQLKDDTLAMINNVANNFPEEAEGIELSRKILQHLSEVSENPYDLTLEMIKKDIQSLF